MQSNTEKYKKLIVPIIRKHLKNVRIVLYGSRARKTDKEGSDIDIALDQGKKIDWSIMSAIIGDIEESDLPILFDIVDFHAVSKDLQNEIEKDGVLWQNR